VLKLSGGSGLAVGITTGLQFLPMLLLSPYGGLIADRFNKQKILKITQAWLALCAAALGVLAVTGVATTAHVYAIAFAFGLGTAFDNPARQSVVSEVAGRDNLANAIGLNSATFHAARIVGPAVAGVVIAAVGSGWAILANAVSYLAFIGALLIMDSQLLRTTPPTPRAKRQIREGLAYILSKPSMLLVISVVFFVGTFGLNFQMTSALMAQQEFHRSAQDYGLLGTLMAVGSLAGALTAARRHGAPSGHRGGDLRAGRDRKRAGTHIFRVRSNPAAVGTGDAADADRGQCLDPTWRRSVTARPSHGSLHYGADGWHRDRLADHRLGWPDHGPAMDLDHRRRSNCDRSLGKPSDHGTPVTGG
jgi:MFS family permease